MTKEKWFESERLKFVKPSYKYAIDYCIMINDENVRAGLCEYIQEQPMLTECDEKKYIKECIEKEENGEGYFFVILEKQTHKFVGLIDIVEVNDFNTMGIALTPTMQNKGYGTEAIVALIDWYRSIGSTEIHLSTFKSNARAIHVYEKLGFQKFYENENVNCYVYSIGD